MKNNTSFLQSHNETYVKIMGGMFTSYFFVNAKLMNDDLKMERNPGILIFNFLGFFCVNFF
jgi:hypothetical protein